MAYAALAICHQHVWLAGGVLGVDLQVEVRLGAQLPAAAAAGGGGSVLRPHRVHQQQQQQQQQGEEAQCSDPIEYTRVKGLQGFKGGGV